MAKYLLVRFAECNDTTREEEFNEWYTNVHVVDMLEHPAIKRGSRYVNLENIGRHPGPAKYLALYELETDDLKKTLKEIKINMDNKRAQKPDSPLIKIINMSTYKQISSVSKRKSSRKE